MTRAIAKPSLAAQHVRGNMCVVSPRGRHGIAWLSLTLPALLSQPLCRQIGFTAMAKNLPGLVDILVALNQHQSHPSQPSEQPCMYSDSTSFAKSSFRRKQPAADRLRSA